MNQTIRSRIEQIKRGAIPDGYKKTKVGIVPKEWTEHTLSEFFDFKNGLNKEKEAFGKGTPIVNYTDVWGKRGLLKENIKGKVLLSKNEIDLYKVEEGDVFFTRTSETIEEIGLSSVLLEPINDCVFSGFVLRARPKKAGIVKEYNIYCYSSAIMRHEITRKSSMTTRALTNGTLLGEVNINLPNQKEQEKIAEILQEQDRLIELKEKLIEEKKKQKQYLMRVLLTGKVRLPGFNNKWVLIPLGQVSDMSSGGTPLTSKQEYFGNDHIWVSIADMSSAGKYIFDSKIKLSNLGLNNCSARLFKKGTVLFAMYASIGESVIAGEECCTSQAILGIVPDAERLNNEFLYYSLMQKKLSIIAMQQASSQPNLNKGLVQSIQIELPPRIEQIAIVNVLSKADRELELLQKELEEQKRKKQSLMQLLLTGIVKVKA